MVKAHLYSYILIRTCCKRCSEWLASTHISQRYQVHCVLLSWSQTGLDKGSDGTRELCSHPTIIILGENKEQIKMIKSQNHFRASCQFQTVQAKLFSAEIWGVTGNVSTIKQKTVSHSAELRTIDFSEL